MHHTECILQQRARFPLDELRAKLGKHVDSRIVPKFGEQEKAKLTEEMSKASAALLYECLSDRKTLTRELKRIQGEIGDVLPAFAKRNLDRCIRSRSVSYSRSRSTSDDDEISPPCSVRSDVDTDPHDLSDDLTSYDSSDVDSDF